MRIGRCAGQTAHTMRYVPSILHANSIVVRVSKLLEFSCAAIDLAAFMDFIIFLKEVLHAFMPQQTCFYFERGAITDAKWYRVRGTERKSPDCKNARLCPN